MFSSSLALTPGFLFFRKGRQELCCEVFIRREQRQKVQMQRTKKQRQLELGHFSNQFFLCFLTGTQMPTRQWIPQYIHILQIVCFVAAMKEQTHLRYEGCGEFCFIYAIASRKCCCCQQFHLEPAIWGFYIAYRYRLQDKIGN